MRIIILEDSDSDYRLLKSIIDECIGKMNLAPPETVRYTDGTALVREISSWHEHGGGGSYLFFLDIVVPGELSGVETAHRIRDKYESAHIVFTTSNKEYALDGFRVHADDYLVKPYDAKDVTAILGKFFEENAASAYISVLSDRVEIPVCVRKIKYAEMQGHIINIAMSDGKTIQTYMSFEKFVSLLSDRPCFEQCYRGIIVSFDYVEQITAEGVRISTGQLLPISRNKYSEIRDKYCNYIIRKTREGVN